jgi:hypothetical protein
MARRCKPNSGLNTLGAERIFYRAKEQQVVGDSPMEPWDAFEVLEKVV